MSSLSVGLVGLPNTGKSTLFQAITKKQVDRANYPFCTIEPNLGVVAVPDERLTALAGIFPREKKISATVEFVDIAGLIKGASQGEGLGNKFLSHIRQVDALIYVLRGFQKESVINIQKAIDPWAEKEILDAELALKDLETIESRIESLTKEIKSKLPEAVKESETLDRFGQWLKEGKMLVEISRTEFDQEVVARYQFLTAKPRLFLINAAESEVAEETKKRFQGKSWLILDVLTELEAADLTDNERKEMGLADGLGQLIQASYSLLNLITFFTVGRNEVRAWTLPRGRTAAQAGGVIHTDFQQKFIRAEVVNWSDLVSSGGYVSARQKGLVRTEGRDYLVQDGDVIEIKAGA